MTTSHGSANAAAAAPSQAFRTLTIERLLGESLTQTDTRTPRLTLMAGRNEPWTAASMPGFLPDVVEMGLRGAIYPFVEDHGYVGEDTAGTASNTVLPGAEDVLLEDEIVTSVYLSPTIISKLSTIAGKWVRPLLDGSTKLALVQRSANADDANAQEKGAGSGRPRYRLEMLNRKANHDPSNIRMPNASLALVLQWALGDDEQDRLQLVVPVLDDAGRDVLFGQFADPNAPIEIRNFGVNTGGQVITTSHVPEGEALFNIETYILLAGPTYQSVRLAGGFHALATYVSAMNHSCDPSAHINVERRVVTARRDLKPGDEVNFYYPSTEVDIVQPFDCACGAPNCIGYVASQTENKNEASVPSQAMA